MKKKWLLLFGLLVLFSFGGEWLYFQTIYRTSTTDPSSGDVVLVYGGKLGRSEAGLALANRYHLPLFVSDTYGGPKDFEQKIGVSWGSVVVDHYARTTDQNARNAVRFLKQGGYRKGLLVTSWYHMPRALFLTRYYLMGTSIHVEPYYFDMTESFVNQPDFWAEIFRFWGSLGRVALALGGFEKPVFHYFD